MHAAEEKAFRTAVKAISATPVASTSSDETRRDCPVADVDPQFLKQFAEVLPADAQEAWKLFCDRFSDHVAAAGPSRETRHLHPVLRLMLEAVLAMGQGGHRLRLFCEKVAHDGISKAKGQPDFILTHERDAQPSMIGAVVMIEAKLPGKLKAAEQQSRAFGRRFVFKRFNEARSRAEPGDTVFSVVAGTNGRYVTFSRVVSGAAPAGVSFTDLEPCPTTCSEQLELLPTWDGISLPDLPDTAPAGFEALMRVLRSPIQQLSGHVTSLSSLNVRWSDATEETQDEVKLGTCIGHGGTSDVYSIEGRNDAVIKVGRFTSVGMLKAYESEIKALRGLADTAGARGLVPVLLRSGELIPSHSTVSPSPRWLVLELSPLGVPLEQWLQSSALAPAGLLAAADLIASRVVAALVWAHDEDIIHCDVRPSNVIMNGDDAVLADFGVSHRAGTDCAHVGVAAYAVDGVFNQNSYIARPSQDLPVALHRVRRRQGAVGG